MNLNSMQPILTNQSKRQRAILENHPDRHTRIRQTAEAIGRYNIATAKARTLETAVRAFVAELYDREPESQALWNIDSADGRILIPCPWGRAGHRRWGLRRGEGDILRMLAMHWQNIDSPFVYSPLLRQWYLDISTYPIPGAVMAWLVQHPIDAATWRILHTQYMAKLQNRVGGSLKGSREGSSQ